MNVAMVSSYDYFYPGGVAGHMRSLVAALRRRGHDVTVIAPGESGAGDGVTGYLRAGRSWVVRGNGSRAHIGLPVRLPSPVRTAMARTRFDVVHHHEPLLPTVPMLVLRAHRGASVGTFHATAESSPAYRCARPVLTRYFRRLHMCIAVSEPARDFARRYFPGDFRIVPNGVDTTRFHPGVPPAVGLRTPGKATLLFVGRLEPRKGLPTLLDAFAAVRRDRADARLVVVGDGPMRAECIRQVMRHRIPDVTFTGFVEAAALPGCYTAADVFCAPATGQESFGVVLLEAMASGRAVVASAIPGYSRIVSHDRTGVLVPPRDVSAWVRALHHLLDDTAERRRLGGAGVTDAARFDWDRVVDEVLDVYAEAIARHRDGIVAADAVTPTGACGRRPAAG